MAFNDEKKRPAALNLTPQRTMSAGSVSSNNSSSTSSSLAKPPRTPRFAEATSVHSPVDGRTLPFSSEQSEVAHAQPGDVGFGYIGNGGNRESVTMPMTPRSPLKSALKVPGTPGRSLANPLSPTFREEEELEQKEELTEKEQARDLKIKTRVRLAKLALRGVNFSCSLIILSMLSASFMIFRATRHLPAMNGLPAWATGTNPWPQYVVLSCSCVSLAICIGIFIGYCRGGHNRAEKVGVYYTLFAVGWFIFSMIMWAVAAGIFQFTKNNSKNQDMWGWSCVENHRAELFKDKVNYALVCRLQNWGLVCMIIEIIIEIISITLYSVIFYRYWSKRKLLKSMNMRDKARSDLYLAQLRVQSAPNTPGFGPKSPTFSQYALSPRFPPSQYQSFDDVEKGYGAGIPQQQQQQQPFTPGGGGQRLIIPQSSSFSSPKLDTGFKLQAPPSKANPATPVTPKGGFMTPSSSNPVSPVDPMPQINLPQPPPPVVQIAHAPMADGEQQYEAVPIPGAYAGQAIRNPPPPMQTRFA